MDESYEMIRTMRSMISEAQTLVALESRYNPLIELIREQDPEAGLEAVKALESEVDALTETHRIKSKLSRAKRALRGNNPDKEQAVAEVMESAQRLQDEVEWRQRAEKELAGQLADYDDAIKLTIGMRMQERLTGEQAESIADCLAVHKDLTLHF